MPSQKFFILFFLCSPFLAVAHPFYKTMPKEVEHIYDELKDMEKEAIEAFKEAYPKIPACWWGHVDFIPNQVQAWLKDAASGNDIEVQEPTIGKNCTEEEIAKYCKCYIEYECKKQNLDINKIQVKSVSFVGTTIIAQASSGSSNVYDRQDAPIDIESIKTIKIDLIKFINAQEPLRIHVCKHELVHITEAHGVEEGVIQLLVEHFYGPKEIETNEYLNLKINLNKTQELIADVLPSLLSPEYTSKYLQNIDFLRQKDVFYPTGATVDVWLKKICSALCINKIFTYFDIFYSHE